MIRFDANGKPIMEDNAYQGSSHSNNSTNNTDSNEEATLHPEFNDTFAQSNINNNTTYPMEQINGFEVARRAIVNECNKKHYPIVGAVLGGIGYGLEAFFSSGADVDPRRRHYGS